MRNAGMQRFRARQLGLTLGDLPAGPRNAISDVAGVRVGHTTLIEGDGPLRPGQGPIRTGVTVVLPHPGNVYRAKVRAAVHTINGYGKACGFEQVRELGVLESPIALTGTLNVPRVADALIDYAIARNPDIGITTSSVNVVVGETSDAYLNDLQGRHVSVAHVVAALASASAEVAEGNVGAGTGITCFCWKGGNGTATRVMPIESAGFTLGALVQSNFGRAPDLVIDGVPVGRLITPDRYSDPIERGSIMIVLATDAPLSSRQLERIARRSGAALARVGSHYGHGSGDFVIAFSTANQVAHEAAGIAVTQTALADEARVIESLFRAAVESVEEAIVNSLCMAHTLTGRDGHVRYALPIAELLAEFGGD
ncbi:MAG: P1 family peptidase [Chloroflexi bacterium]|nr:P1 family peptidase [Chloroflexota bacterium]